MMVGGCSSNEKETSPLRGANSSSLLLKIMMLVGPVLPAILTAKFEFPTDLFFVVCIVAFFIAQLGLIEVDLSTDCLLLIAPTLVLPKAMVLGRVELFGVFTP